MMKLKFEGIKPLNYFDPKMSISHTEFMMVHRHGLMFDVILGQSEFL